MTNEALAEKVRELIDELGPDENGITTSVVLVYAVADGIFAILLSYGIEEEWALCFDHFRYTLDDDHPENTECDLEGESDEEVELQEEEAELLEEGDESSGSVKFLFSSLNWMKDPEDAVEELGDRLMCRLEGEDIIWYADPVLCN